MIALSRVTFRGFVGKYRTLELQNLCRYKAL
jgi:hypothetical protein